MEQKYITTLTGILNTTTATKRLKAVCAVSLRKLVSGLLSITEEGLNILRYNETDKDDCQGRYRGIENDVRALFGNECNITIKRDAEDPHTYHVYLKPVA